MVFTNEKKSIAEFIQLYREQSCLWDTSHKMYTNKLARNRAHDVLLVKYKELDPFADRRRMKKKIENMRTAYKRERAKVIKSKLSGEELYEPTLWYYSMLTFLDEDNDANENETTFAEQNDTTFDNGDADDDTICPEEKPMPPRFATENAVPVCTMICPEEKPTPLRCNTENAVPDCTMICPEEKPTPLRFNTENAVPVCTERSDSPPPKRSKPTSIYLKEDDNDYVIETAKRVPPKKNTSVYLEVDDSIYQEEPSCSVKNEPTDLYLGQSAESDLYGKTISNQLNELRPKQRFIAEKLISDVIFFARLDKLRTGTSINLNNDL